MMLAVNGLMSEAVRRDGRLGKDSWREGGRRDGTVVATIWEGVGRRDRCGMGEREA